MSVVASQITESRLFVQPFVQAQIKGNIKAPCNWIVVMRIHRSPVDSPIKRTVTRRKYLLLMTSSWSSLDQLGFYQFDQILILYYDTRHPMNNWLQQAKNKVVRKDLIWNISIGKLRFFSNERHYTKTFHSTLTLLIFFAKRNLHPHWRILLSSMARSSRSCFLVDMLVSLVNAWPTRVWSLVSGLSGYIPRSTVNHLPHENHRQDGASCRKVICSTYALPNIYIYVYIWAILIITGWPTFKVCCFVISLLFN